ncbi:MAG: hypothetical protein V3W19_13940 [Desulfatiglandales bacterium]
MKDWIEKTIAERFSDVDVDRLDNVAIIHLDNPSKVQRAMRLEDPMSLVLEDDCPLCQETRRNTGIIIFSGDSSLLLQEQGMVVAGSKN